MKILLTLFEFQVKWQARLFDVIHSSKFETLIMAMICLNMLVMMIQHHGQSDEVVLTMNILFKNYYYVILLQMCQGQMSCHS